MVALQTISIKYNQSTELKKRVLDFICNYYVLDVCYKDTLSIAKKLYKHEMLADKTATPKMIIPEGQADVFVSLRVRAH